MKGTYIEYNKNVYKVIEYCTYEESVKVKLIKQVNPIFCKDPEHSQWVEEGKIWPSKFFEKAQPISKAQVELLYNV